MSNHTLIGAIIAGIPLAVFAVQNADGKQADLKKPKAITITGTVQNSQKTPIAGVVVTVLTAGRGDSVSAAKTDADGSYKIVAQLTSSFDVLYTHTKWNLSVVPALSETKDQNINKVLYAKGEEISATALLDFMQGIERLQLFAAHSDKAERSRFLALAEETGAWQFLEDSFPPKMAKLSGDSTELLKLKFEQLRKAKLLLQKVKQE